MPTRADYAKINIACKALGLDRKTLIIDRYGLESSKLLTGAQVRDLLGHFRRLGWRPKRGQAKNRPGFIEIKPGPMARMQRKVLALWNSLGYEPVKLHRRCKKQFNIDRFDWVTDYDDLHILITDLTARCRRAGINCDD